MMRAGSKQIMTPAIGSLAAASRHARFAEWIGRRYTLRSLQRRSPLSMTFARRCTLQTFMQRHWHRSTLMVAPRIEIRLQAVRRVIASGGSGGETPSTVSHPPRLNPARYMAEALIEYVEARARRIEPTAMLSSAASTSNRPVPRVVRRIEPTAMLGSTASTSNRPVPRVVRRFAPASFSPDAVDAGPVQSSMMECLAAAPVKERGASVARSANLHRTRPGPGSPVMAAPAIDVDRLTEQVIQGIDRRIIAQRERLGRF